MNETGQLYRLFQHFPFTYTIVSTQTFIILKRQRIGIQIVPASSFTQLHQTSCFSCFGPQLLLLGRCFPTRSTNSCHTCALSTVRRLSSDLRITRTNGRGLRDARSPYRKVRDITTECDLLPQRAIDGARPPTAASETDSAPLHGWHYETYYLRPRHHECQHVVFFHDSVAFELLVAE